MRSGFATTLVVALLVILTQLGTPRLWDRDEPRNAQCAREMFERGDWIVPTFDGELRTHKPALLYWGQITSYHLFGVSEWSARLPSALAGLATVLLVFALGLRFANPAVAAWSAVALSTMLLFAMAARAATPDAVLVACITAAITLFVYCAYRPDQSNVSPSEQADGGARPAEESASALRGLQSVWPSHFAWVGIYAVCGLAVLAKGPVGLVMPVAVLSLTLVVTHGNHLRWRAASRRRLLEDPRSSEQPLIVTSSIDRVFAAGLRAVVRLVEVGWKMRPVTALAMVALVAGPWYAAVGWQTDGVWLREFFWTHNVSRAIEPMEGHGGPPVLFYLGALLVGTFPWSCFAIPIALSVWHRRRATGGAVQPMVVLSIAWIAVFLGVFSIASTKLPSYITPCYPAAALLVGWYMACGVRGWLTHPRWMTAGLVVAMLIGIGLAWGIAVPLASQVPTVRLVAVAGIVFAVAAGLGVALARRQRPGYALRAFAIGAVALTWILHGFGPAAVDAGRQDLDRLQAAFAGDEQTRWVAEGAIEPSWIFYSNRRVVATQDEAATAATSPRSAWGAIRVADQPLPGSVPLFLDDQYLTIEPPKPPASRISRSLDPAAAGRGR